MYAFSEAMTILDRKKATAMVIVLISALNPMIGNPRLFPLCRARRTGPIRF